MKMRIRKLWEFGRFPCYHIQYYTYDKHWVSLCKTFDDDKEKATIIKNALKHYEPKTFLKG